MEIELFSLSDVCLHKHGVQFKRIIARKWTPTNTKSLFSSQITALTLLLSLLEWFVVASSEESSEKQFQVARTVYPAIKCLNHFRTPLLVAECGLLDVSQQTAPKHCNVHARNHCEVIFCALQKGNVLFSYIKHWTWCMICNGSSREQTEQTARVERVKTRALTISWS